jgi:inhibitor of cysteine peptidase
MNRKRTFLISAAVGYLTSGAVLATNDTTKRVVLDFTQPDKVHKLARWTDPQHMRATSDGFGWIGDAQEHRKVTIRLTDPISVGWSWCPADSVQINVDVVPASATPGTLYARYSPDSQHWSKWHPLTVHIPEPAGAGATLSFRGTLAVSAAAKQEYRTRLQEFAGAGRPLADVDQEAAARWIVGRDPTFFSTQMPFIGYVDVRWETAIGGNLRLKTMSVEISYSRDDRGAVPPGHDGQCSWRFKMPQGGTEDSDKMVRLSESDNGKTITVAAGAPIVIVLEGNIATGYRWKCVGLSGDAVEQTGDAEYQDDPHPPNRMGSGGKFTIPFEAAKPGTSSIRLGYSRPWEADVAPIRGFTVTVVVK